jgi:hypothetical protein
MSFILNPYWHKEPRTWVREITFNAGVTPGGANILTDEEGNVFHLVPVYVSSSPIPLYEPSVIVTKFSSNGSLLWSKHINRELGFQNQMTITYDYNWFAALGPQGLIIVAGSGNDAEDTAPSRYTKVLCLSELDGSLKWAKSLSRTPLGGYGQPRCFFSNVTANSITGHTYLVFSYGNYGYNASEMTVITLGPDGSITGAVSSSLPSSSGPLPIKGGITNQDGAVALNAVGSFGSCTLLLNSDGSINRGMRVYAGISLRNLASLKQNGNILWPSEQGVVEFNSDLTSVDSLYSSLGSMYNIQERADGSYVAINNLTAPESTGWGTLTPNVWGNSSMYVINSNFTQIQAIREIGYGPGAGSPNTYPKVSGASPNVDRYVVASPYDYGLVIISFNASFEYDRYQTSSSNYVKFMSPTAGLPRSITEGSLPIVSNPSLSYSAISTIINDYSSSVVVENSTQIWSFYTSP